jgi:hypothetical protein
MLRIVALLAALVVDIPAAQAEPEAIALRTIMNWRFVPARG